MFVIPTEKFIYSFQVSNTNMTYDEMIKNLKIILHSADMIYDEKDYTSATILYFKAAFLAIDGILIREKGKSPKDHTERFRMLEKDYPDIYEFLDKRFKIYRDTYSASIDKQSCDKVRQDVKEIISRYKISL